MKWDAWARVWERLRASFWTVPAIFTLFALLLALVVPVVDERLSTDLPLLFGGGPDGARALLSAVVTAMISFTGLVFSVTVVALQLASAEYSPRVLRTFLRSKVTQIALGVFTSTFVYALVVLRSVRDETTEGGSFVPQLAVTLAFLFVLASVGVFIAYIHHTTQSIRVSTILRSVGDETRALVAARSENSETGDPNRRVVLDAPRTVLPAPGPGVIVRFDYSALVATAKRHDLVFVLRSAVGTFVPEGMPLIEVHPDLHHRDEQPQLGRSLERKLTKFVYIEPERTMEQDIAFGLRQLVDVAQRALSPGINDPTTAVQALNEIHDILRRLAVLPDPSPYHRDADGEIRVIEPPSLFADQLDLALDEPMQSGKDALQVRERISSILEDLARVALPPHHPTVMRKIAVFGLQPT